MKSSIIILATLVVFASGCSDADSKEAKDTKAAPSAPTFQLTKVEKADVDQTIKLPAQLAAYLEVSIFPKVNGYVKTVSVDIGSQVKQGQLLMTLEAPELEQEVAEAKEKWAQSKLDYTIAKEQYARLKEAAETPGAISPLDLATSKSKMLADSALSNAEKSNWERQQTMMGYLIVRAPFDGVITLRNVHPGALVSAEAKDGKPMLELKQINHLRLQIDIPEELSAQLKQKDTISFYLSAFPGKKFSGHIARKSMNVNEQYRTERVELDAYNPNNTLAPGMYSDVIIDSRGTLGALSVPKSAVVTSTVRKYVLVAKDGKAHMVDVSTGNESAKNIEVLGNLQVGDEIIVNANDEIKEGQAISEK